MARAPGGVLDGGSRQCPPPGATQASSPPSDLRLPYARGLGFSSNEGDAGTYPSSPTLVLARLGNAASQLPLRGQPRRKALRSYPAGQVRRKETRPPPSTPPPPLREARRDKGIIQCASRYAFTTAPMPASECGELHTQEYLVLFSRVGVKLVLSRIICPISNCQAVQLIPFCCM